MTKCTGHYGSLNGLIVNDFLTYFNISLTQVFISTHTEHLRSGNEHALEETLQRPLKWLVQDEASRGGGVEGDVVPQPQVDI